MTLERISESFEHQCIPEQIKASKLPQKECTQKAMEALQECKTITVNGLNDMITKDQIGVLIWRMTLCNIKLLADEEYTNEIADRFTNKL